MIIQRPSNERGPADHGWLKSQHTFSFANYYDPAWMGFGPLRVINEDSVAAGGGFAPHGHANMEIISVVLSGQLAHRDSEGNQGIIKAGDVQWMSAGSGVQHSEMNGSNDEPVHFLQIWIQPNQVNAKPMYGQNHYAFNDRLKDWVTLAAPEGEGGGLPIRQDAKLFGRGLEVGATAQRTLDPSRKYWLQVIVGGVTVKLGDHVQMVEQGDALGFADENGVLELKNDTEAETQLLWFELA